MFRGKESSNRITLSRLVQELLNFGVFGSLWLWGWGWLWVVGGWVCGGGGGWGVGWVVGELGGCMGRGVPHTHVHMHTHTCMCGKHDNFMQMATPIWRNPWEFPMMSYVHVHACVGGTLSPPPSTHPHPPGDPWYQSKFKST